MSLSPTTTSARGDDQARDPLDLGVGARLTVSVMSDDYVAILLTALADTAASSAPGLVVESDDVSTYVGGAEAGVLAYIVDLIARVSASGAHVVAHVQLSRGCPGELTCGLDAPTLAIPDLTPLAPTGVEATAQWALYPLADGPGADHMSHIMEVIERAKAAGVARASRHFVTELAGDLADVLGTVADGWLAAGRSVAHVVTHVTISTNHPDGEAPATEVAR